MFSLILTILSIALVAALALVTIYYGGTAFNRKIDEYSSRVNNGQRVGKFQMSEKSSWKFNKLRHAY